MFSAAFLRSFRNNTAAITDTGERISYGELADFTDVMADKIGQRCLIFQLCSNQLGSLAGYVSFLSIKVVPLLLDASLERGLLQNLISTYQPLYIWLPAEKKNDFPDAEIVLEAFGYLLVKTVQDNVYPLHADLALLFTTSGSTGSPKLVRISYENISSNARAIAEYLSITAAERPITVLPMHYSYGLSIVNSHLWKGATILLTDSSLMEKEFWFFLKTEKASSISGVPYTYEILQKLRFTRMDLPSVTTLTQAGGKLNDSLCANFASFCAASGKRFFVMYGQTEATARMAYLPAEYAVTKTGSIGKAIPGGEINLADETGTSIETVNKIGELVYHGRNVSMGYAEKGYDLGREDENKGVLFTGDMARRDEEGFYYIVGRKTRFIKLFGNRVSLDETENILKSMVTDCACVGNDDKMIVYITETGREQEVQDYISQKTGINRNAFLVKQIADIPKNTSGKILYSNLALS
jgi:long-chain acyl-CoA synthetase